MKIAFLTDGIAPFITGGMQQHSASLAKNLVIKGHKVDLFHFVSNDCEIPSKNELNTLFFNDKYSFNNVFCTKFPTSIYFPGHYLWNSYRYSSWIYSILKHNYKEYDFIYAKGFTSWKLIAKTKRNNSFSPPIGVKFHGYEMYQFAPNFSLKLKHWMLRPIVKWINVNSDFVFSYGSKITNLILDLGVRNDRILNIPSGIEKDMIVKSINPSTEKRKFLFIGRNERRKGLIELHDSIKKLSIDYSKAEFHFIGPIYNDEKISNINLNIFYHGLIKDVKKKNEIIDNCDILICPSFSEGMPNVILESMARGLAIIASNVGAITLMVDSENGIIINEIKEESILESIIKLYSMSNREIDHLKNNSLSKVDSFSWDKIINIMENKINT